MRPWFLTRHKQTRRLRHRAAETLFVDARTLGAMVDCVHLELTDRRCHEGSHAAIATNLKELGHID